MDRGLVSKRSFCIFSGLSGIIGVVLILVSFHINPGPPPSATSAELMRFGQQYYASILWGAWLQAVGPVFIVLFAFLAGATQRLAGWMTLFGATILMTVSLIEITFYIGALHTDPQMMPFISLKLISAAQHLYFIVAAPALFLPLGIVLISSSILPRLFGYLALLFSNCFCSFRRDFSAHSDTAWASYSIRRSPSALVAGRCYHPRRSPWENSKYLGNDRGRGFTGGLRSTHTQCKSAEVC